MFEVLYRLTALVESDGHEHYVFRVMRQMDLVDDDGFLALVATTYEQDVYPTLRAGDNLTVMVHLDLPPREVERTLHFLGDGQFKQEGKAELITDLPSLIASMFGYFRLDLQPGDVLTVSFRIQRL